MALKWKFLELYLLAFCVFLLGKCQNGLDPEPINYCKDVFEHCECMDNYIYCENQGLTDITVLQPYINNGTTSIILKGNDFKELPSDLFQGCSKGLHNLFNLELSSSNIQTLPDDSFKCMDKLEKLSLINNSLRADSFVRSFRVESRTLKRLNLSFAFDTSGESLDSKKMGILFKKDELFGLERLDLSGNNIKGLYYDAGSELCSLVSLKQLNLSHNNISTAMIRECMVALEVLDLSYNNLDQLTPSLMDSIEAFLNLRQVRLDNNPYTCNCYIQSMVDWLNSTLQPIDKDSVICGDGDSSVVGTPLMDIKNISALYCPEPRVIVCPGPPIYTAKTSMIITVVVIGLSLLASSIVIISIIRRRRGRSGQLSVVTDALNSKLEGPPYKRIA